MLSRQFGRVSQAGGLFALLWCGEWTVPQATCEPNVWLCFRMSVECLLIRLLCLLILW